MDNSYQDYINKVTQISLPNNYLQQLQNIQTSSKFTDGKPVNFPGYTIITPPWENETNNQNFYEQLQSCQEKLSQKLDKNLFIPVPTSSFHLTVADLIWEKIYLNAVAENPDFDNQLIEEIKTIFKSYKESLIDKKTLELELLGLSVFPRAIIVCLAPIESSYETILNLRREIYQNKNITKLGIEQHYDFTAHITLGYFGEIPANLDINNIENILTSINDEWLDNQPPNFLINQVELRKFDDMISYQRQSNWPIIKF